MLGKKSDNDIEKMRDLSTILGRGSMLEGTLSVQHSLRVDGKLKGKISTTESLVVGKEGEIEGDAAVKNAVIGGKMMGNLTAAGKVVLEAKALFQGELKTAKLVIDEGAVFNGRCSMDESPGVSGGFKPVKEKPAVEKGEVPVK